MSKRKKAGVNKAIRKKTIKRSEQTMFSITIATLLVVGALVGFQLFGTAEPSKAEIRIAPPQVGSMSVVKVDDSNVGSALDPNAPLVGVVSGHKGYDPGAVCADGLSEVEVNHAIALEVVSLLNRRGIRADLLDEFDDRLTDYQADALVSIHSDSCNIPGATGFKVARVTDSAIPEAEDILVACLNQEYQTYTGLPQHPASITDGMTSYHAFGEIADHTPGAIIETGFLLDDRHLLQYRPKVVARGIAAGIICFLDNTAEE
jgi:N-acetylmuramoyl-L-alanine amidase